MSFPIRPVRLLVAAALLGAAVIATMGAGRDPTGQPQARLSGSPALVRVALPASLRAGPVAVPAPAPVPIRVPLPDSLRQGQGPLDTRGGGGTQLHLIKIVLNEGGGTASDTDWLLRATGSSTTGATNLAGVTPVDSGLDFKPDTYALSETYVGSDPAAGQSYEAEPWICVDTGTGAAVDVVDGRVTVRAGDDITCTITNVYINSSPTPSPSPSPSPSPTPTPEDCSGRIRGHKLYVARTGPFFGTLVGLSGWRVTATLVGREDLTVSTTTDALGGYEFTRAMLGGMVFSGATIRVCEEARPLWINLAPLCRNVTLPTPLEGGPCVPDMDFQNMQFALDYR